MGSGNVDEGDDRQAESFGELHEPDGLAIALWVRHPEVAPDVLVGVGALLLADDGNAADHRAGPAPHDGGVVAEQPVPVQFDEVVGHLVENSRVRGRREVACQLDAAPDLLAVRSPFAVVRQGAGSAAVGAGLGHAVGERR